METTTESSTRPVGTGPAEAAPERPLDSQPAEATATTARAEKTEEGAAEATTTTTDAETIEEVAEAAVPADGDEQPPSGATRPEALVPDRRRIEEQLEALKRKELELRRELAMAEHPALAEAIRVLEGCVYSVSRADAKLAQGLTKSEERRKETLGKKIATLTEKRDAIDAQITQLHEELSSLGEERVRGFESERRAAMERLVAGLGKHGGALQEANLEASELLPQIGGWMDEIRRVAKEMVDSRDRTSGDSG